MEKLNGIEFNNNLNYKDIVIFLYVEQYPLKDAKQLSVITSCNYSRLTESLNRLIKYNLIIKTEHYPHKFIKNG